MKEFSSTDEFAKIIGKADLTVREDGRLGRIAAVKKGSGRGKFQSWVVSHEELLRYQRSGLLPVRNGQPGITPMVSMSRRPGGARKHSKTRGINAVAT